MSEEDRVAKLEKKVQDLETKLRDVEAKCSPRISAGGGTYAPEETPKPEVFTEPFEIPKKIAEQAQEAGLIEEATEAESTEPSESEAEATPSDQE